MKAQIKGLNYGLRPSKEYMDWGKPDKALSVLAVDQAKFNLTYLVFPEIEKGGLSVLPKDYVDNLGSLMDKETRSNLYKLPLTFMRYWSDMHKKLSPVPLTIVMPDDYMSRMVCQAHRVQARMIEKEGNVSKVSFGGPARS